LQCGYPQVDMFRVIDKAKENIDEIGPLQLRDLDGGDRSNGHGSKGTGTHSCGPEGHKNLLLDRISSLSIDSEPAIVVLCLPNTFLR
jgi:hypothetical protein